MFLADTQYKYISQVILRVSYSILTFTLQSRPVPVAARSSPAEIVGSNPTGAMDGFLLWVSCVVR